MYPFSKDIDVMKNLIDSEDFRPSHIYDMLDPINQQNNLESLQSNTENGLKRIKNPSELKGESVMRIDMIGDTRSNECANWS